MPRKFTKGLQRIFLALLSACGIYASYLATIDESDLPPLRDGDLVFQTTWTNQSLAVGVATGSLYLHTGIVEQTDHGPVIIHAGAKVGKESLHDWIDGGILKRFAVYRYRNLSAEQGKHIVQAARQYIGRNYDLYFLFDNDTIYCSELPYLAFKQSNIALGTVKKIGELSVNNAFVKKLIEQRWRNYPKCREDGLTFERCYDIIMAQELISPVELSDDPKLERIFTNYP